MSQIICHNYFTHSFFFFISSVIVLFTTTNASYKCIDKERDALLHFKSLIHNDPKGYLSTWMIEEEATNSNDCCNWDNVECNNHSRVTGIELSMGDLEGKISPSLLNLSYLDFLDLSENSLHGFIPKFIGSMARLRSLNLGFNDFTGTIPPELGNLTNLKYLSLGSNCFTGAVPPVLGNLANLEDLSLSYNGFTGTIPPELGNLTNLKYLSLEYLTSCTVENQDWLSELSHLEELYMDGTSLAKLDNWGNTILIFQKLSYLSLVECDLSHVMHSYSFNSSSSSSSSIVELHLDRNNLDTSMYQWLYPLTSNALKYLSLSGNKLDWIPEYLGNLCSLCDFYFDDNSMPVKFPDFLTNLSECTSHTLRKLDASNSHFFGPLANIIQKFTLLMYLDLSNNQLNISENVWKLPNLWMLDVSDNPLIEVPSEAQVSNISISIDIYWSFCKLGPTFPKWIQALKNPTAIDISYNNISDTIPVEFWNTWPSQLGYLNLSFNNITGIITDLSSNFAQPFATIDLSSNNFYGPIPNVPSGLLELDLSRNKFYGEISFLCQMIDGFITSIDLSHNLFSGQIPNCLYHFQALEFLNLGHNILSGRLPASIGYLTNLGFLNLYNNSFSGEFPLYLMNCSYLKILELGVNKFSGYVPTWIGEKLKGLHSLSLTSNNFFGTIPSQLCGLVHLQILDLSINNLYGTIPSCLSNLSLHSLNFNKVTRGLPPDFRHSFYIITGPKKYIDHVMIKWQGCLREFSSTLGLLKIIDLSSNNLTGKIPHDITNMNELIALNLSMNALHGEIPTNIDKMKKLLTLDLSRNNLSGGIPSSMAYMTLLNYLDVSYNNLSGRIPSSTQLQSFDPSRYIGNVGLCGLPLSKHCPEVPHVINEMEDTNGVDDIDDLQVWFYIGCATGFSVGFWVVCIALLVNRRGRHAFFHLLDILENWVYVKVLVLIAKSQRVANP